MSDKNRGWCIKKVSPSPCSLVNACSIVDILMLDILHLQSFTMDVSYLGVYHLFRQKLKSSNVQSDDVCILKTPNNKLEATIKENPMILISKPQAQRGCFTCIFNSLQSTESVFMYFLFNLIYIFFFNCNISKLYESIPIMKMIRLSRRPCDRKRVL